MTRRTTQKPMHPLISKNIAIGVAAAEEIQQVASYLAELLRNMHGGEWDAQVDHQAGFVLCIPKMEAA